ncbi:ABC transporter permease [Afipia sp. Root123D2]|uniref:ABC transporter permease n=1 Tax=Afipia sp. Root123D2 TaxID=1736436 RepID=UPI000A8B53AD|nr:ABC transporter permease [Afipia sp. Root123D2]
MRADFLVELTRRRIADRYIGTSSRVFWVILSPIIPLLVNIAVFYFIARIPQIQSMSLPAYAAFMFSGLLPFRIVQKATTESCDLLVGNMEMLKTTVFPLPFLTLSAIGALLVEFMIQCVFMAVLLIVAGSALTWTVVLLPFALLALFTLAIGLSWLLSVLTYALRDLQEIMTVLFSALLYVTPIMYPPESAPPILQTLIYLNPATSYVIIFRDVILPGSGGIHVSAWIAAFSISAFFLVAGWFAVRGAQRFVGDMV